MIYTVTLNPALDYVIQVDNFKAGRINRNRTETIYYGGKGINVSWVLQELGIESTALGFIAGFTGEALHQGLEQAGINTDFIKVKEGMTRINVKMKSDEETEINGKGPLIEEADLNCLFDKISVLSENDILVLSGSIPSCLKSDTYERIIRITDKRVKIIVDAEKDLLLKVLQYHPFLIKPNNIELQDMLKSAMKTDEDIINGAVILQKAGAQNVLVSMAGDGALLLTQTGEIHRIPAARGEVVNSVGAGDSMVAGFLAGYLKTGDFGQGLKLGTACGGATAFHSALATKEQIEEVLKTL